MALHPGHSADRDGEQTTSPMFKIGDYQLRALIVTIMMMAATSALAVFLSLAAAAALSSALRHNTLLVVISGIVFTLSIVGGYVVQKILTHTSDSHNASPNAFFGRQLL
jgi:ABC-type sugar transport system permease subunit